MYHQSYCLLCTQPKSETMGHIIWTNIFYWHMFNHGSNMIFFSMRVSVFQQYVDGLWPLYCSYLLPQQEYFTMAHFTFFILHISSQHSALSSCFFIHKHVSLQPSEKSVCMYIFGLIWMICTSLSCRIRPESW